MSEKTVVIWDECGQSPISFCVLDGDYSELDGIYINNAHQEAEDQDRLNDLIYGEEGQMKNEMLDSFPIDAVKDGAIVIVAGFLP
ncbi:hypothetical protein [Burkholderia pseudomallei]|uniref:hypothetical protein n=1 Tax=Burkholderia pseudomallei TaxID=28450 RepID=UPI000A1A1D2F|nr:hypothetical protein [Burkholderia pseudomallei]ARK86085.1 hypothetical protein BOC42_00535 [Burkholderia pseudomallei]